MTGLVRLNWPKRHELKKKTLRHPPEQQSNNRKTGEKGHELEKRGVATLRQVVAGERNATDGYAGGIRGNRFQNRVRGNCQVSGRAGTLPAGSRKSQNDG